MVGRVLSLGVGVMVLHVNGYGGGRWVKGWGFEYKGVECVEYVEFGGY